ncbi:MAG TPA: CHRD domain-containing protein [Vicinamibacterales bacterium]|nr:CHRD domain-containing protein [Vicinamibacterales bacterium]
MRTRFLGAATAMAVAAACSDSPQPTQPAPISVPLTVEAGAKPGTPENHRTHLTGDEEVPARATNAQGQAIFQIAPDGQSFTYKLIAANIENVIMAHIHCGAAGTNGPIVVWLYPSPDASAPVASGGGRHDGVLAEGTVMASDADHLRELAAGANASCAEGVSTWDELLDRIRAGRTYVNVHTNDGVGSTNTGPGDFPGGEIRGQLTRP